MLLLVSELHIYKKTRCNNKKRYCRLVKICSSKVKILNLKMELLNNTFTYRNWSWGVGPMIIVNDRNMWMHLNKRQFCSADSKRFIFARLNVRRRLTPEIFNLKAQNFNHCGISSCRLEYNHANPPLIINSFVPTRLWN